MALHELGNRPVDGHRRAVALASQAQLQRPELAIRPKRVFADCRGGQRQPVPVAGGKGLARREHGGIAADGGVAALACRLRRCRGTGERGSKRKHSDVYDAHCLDLQHEGRLTQAMSR